jgi:ferredoxin
MAGRITADRERCIGSGMCSVYAGGTFTQDEDAKVVLLDPPGDDPETIRVAIEACPTRALAMNDDGGS